MYCIIFHYISSWGKRCYLLVLDTTRTDIETLHQKIDIVYQFYEARKWPFSISILWHLFSKKLIEINRFLIFCDRIIDFRPEILNNRLIDQSTSPLNKAQRDFPKPEIDSLRYGYVKGPFRREEIPTDLTGKVVWLFSAKVSENPIPFILLHKM